MTARIPDIQTLIQAGFDPRTKLPYKIASHEDMKAAFKKALRVVDEQDAVNRYEWDGLPKGMDGELVERIVYYRGQGMLFKIPTNDSYYFLPYTLGGTGSIDVYGRFTLVTPVAFNGTVSDEKKPKAWIEGLYRKPVYTKDEDFDPNTACVILSDYCRQISQTVLPRQAINDPIIDMEAEMLPFMRTALQNQTGVKGVRVNSADEQQNVDALNDIINAQALSGGKFVAVTGTMDFQDFGEGPIGRAADYMQALESIDNFRLSLYGIQNGGVFQKKDHMLQAEQDLKGGNDSLVYNDGLRLRQDFCDKANAIWGLNISVRPVSMSEGISGDADTETQMEGDNAYDE